MSTTIPSVTDLRTALDVLESVRQTEPNDYAKYHLQRANQTLTELLIDTCPHAFQAFGQCMHCGSYLAEGKTRP